MLEKTAEGDHASNGSGECGVGLMKGHVRTIKLALERNLNQPIPESHNLMTWLVQYAARAYNKYHVGMDGKTPKPRVIGRPVPGLVAQFGESVF